MRRKQLTVVPEKRILIFLFALLTSFRSVHPLVVSGDVHQQQSLPTLLAGDWAAAKSSLRKSICCVVSISGIESCLRSLQEELADNGPADIDLRARIKISSAYTDCLQVRNSVTPSLQTDEEDDNGEKRVYPCTAALEELAQGMASFAEGSLEGVDVFVRIVCASNYRAREPPFHTDKAPLRGYVTLRVVETEFMRRPCSPFEYVGLRTFGDEGQSTKNLQQAQELQFIVMKGDYYYDTLHENRQDLIGSSLLEKVWTRARACVLVLHRGRAEREHLSRLISPMATTIESGIKLVRKENGAMV